MSRTWRFTAPRPASLWLDSDGYTLELTPVPENMILVTATANDHETYIRLDSGQVNALIQFLKTGEVQG